MLPGICRKMCKKIQKGIKKGRYICWSIIITLSVFSLFAYFICTKTLRLDQYATTIFATTAGVVGSMFGLTAASYAFIWGELRSDRQANRHLERVLGNYRKKLWKLFSWSLVLTMVVIFSSLIGLASAQKITAPDLYKTINQARGSLSYFYNEKPFAISLIALFNLEISFIVIGAMAVMNRTIFKRNAQYASLAEKVLEEIDSRYNMEIEERQRKRPSALKGKKNQEEDINSLEYKKIHNLEILIERILKNHESLGDAFAESQRREKLLTSVIMNGLKNGYDLKVENREVVPEKRQTLKAGWSGSIWKIKKGKAVGKNARSMQ